MFWLRVFNEEVIVGEEDGFVDVCRTALLLRFSLLNVDIYLEFDN